jgi:hypothetical protein
MKYRVAVSADIFRSPGDFPLGKLAKDLIVYSDETGDWILMGDDWKQYLHLVLPQKGWFLRANLEPWEDTDPEELPVSDEYILHVKDGVTRRFVPE